MKGAIRDVGRAFGVSLDKVNEITKCAYLDDDGNVKVDNPAIENYLQENHPELLSYATLLMGVIVSIGYHPAGTLVAPHSVTGKLGTYVPRANGRPVAQVDMVQLEDLGYVKLDILGLDNLEVIYNTSKMAGIPMPTPDTLDIYDTKVWNSMRESTAMIFQWESTTAHSYFKRLFSEETLKRIKEQNPNINYMDLLSIGNAAIRPAGDSYRDELAKGIVLDHGHKALNTLLSNTNGYCVYQEQIIEFLHKFCMFDLGKADIVRRAFTSGKDTSVFMPQIEEGFITTMKNEYNMDKNDALIILDNFMKVIIDASNYLFSINHSEPYSYTGYASAYLRYYYPLEFLTASFETFKDDFDKTSEIYEYMTDHTDIKMQPIKFRYSRAAYNFDRETNTIYKGMQSIKYLNEAISEQLYELRKNKYDSFIDLLVDVTENTSVNTRQLEILIRLDYFSEFGNSGKLLAVFEEFKDGKHKYKKTYVDATKEKRIKVLKEVEKTITYKHRTVADIISDEMEYIGHISIVDDRFSPDVAIITQFNTNRWGTGFATLYRLNDGSSEEVKIIKSTLRQNPVKQGDMIQTIELNEKFKNRKGGDGKWYQTDELENILSVYRLVK